MPSIKALTTTGPTGGWNEEIVEAGRTDSRLVYSAMGNTTPSGRLTKQYHE